MDVLKAEIERKRKELENRQLVGPQRKFFKREELIKQTTEEYEQRRRAKHQDEDDDESSSLLSVTSLLKKKQEDERVLPRKEVIRRLRDRSEPILLFGETETEAFHRLRRLEILEPEVDRGLRNDFQEAMEKVDQIYLDEILKSQGKTEDGKSVHDVKVENDTTTLEDIQHIAQELGERRSKGKDAEMILTALRANDAYLQMAIGNAPWPIGVTMVGIHARTGREKIFSQNIARILHFGVPWCAVQCKMR
ncbi:hypothetical protein HPB51_021074 [Rhipicephalus microplus]|uniref:Pre-mRNA-splicing factor 18 n=1 Tax=Rhipicephalus microplus TaxID=6941 RepID=A0A9J6ECR6_RHIMP|nr:hypothetical protein HPB51_021074 [Rhipicephalus microplus]